MANLERQDETHATLQLGRSRVVLDIPSAFMSSFDPASSQRPPDKQLQMEWVYGSRGSDCRNNLISLESSGELVYFMAAVVVLHDVGSGTQRHYTEHTDDVQCIALHPDGNTLATGQSCGHRQVQGKAHIRVWQADNLQTLHVIGESEFQRSVACVAFSSYDKGELLCAVDEANDHHLSVWDWKSEKRLCQAKASKEPIMDVEFNPQEPNAIVSCGRGQISFWTIDDARNLEAKRGTFKDKEAPKYILGLAFSPKGFLVSGDSSGNILVWDKGRNKVTRELAGAHTDAVFSLTFLRDGRLVSGGRAGRLVLWDDACQRKLLDTEVPTAYGAVRCIVQGKGDLLYMETVKNCLLEGSFSDGFSPISVGHRDELWGLAVDSSGRFLTCGDDRLVALRDPDTHKTVWEAQVKQGAHCCDLSSDGKLAIVGSQTGHCIVLDAANSGAILVTKKISREQIQNVKFSPDGQHVALGSRDNKIYIFRVSSNNGQLESVAQCQGHTSFVTHIDWSADGTLLRSNSGDYELLYWKMPVGQREFDDAVTRDASWHTGSCSLTFEVSGVWQDANDGTDVNAVCVNGAGSLCAVGDDFGWVNLYTHPCAVAAPDRQRGGGHSSHVTNVAFSPDGKRLISCGGRDMAVIQWLLV